MIMRGIARESGNLQRAGVIGRTLTRTVCLTCCVLAGRWSNGMVDGAWTKVRTCSVPTSLNKGTFWPATGVAKQESA